MRPVKANQPTKARAVRRPSGAESSAGPDGPPVANGHRRADAVRNREAIVSAAVHVLTHKPDAGLAEVARASGLTRTTVYAHFATREELLEELAGRALDETVRTLDRARPEDGPADEALLRVLHASWQQVGSQARLLDMIGSALGPRAAEMHAPVRERLLKLIRRGRRDGAFRRDLPERWLMTTYFTLVHAAGHEVAVGHATSGEAEKALSKLLLGAFGAVER
jgi:AcrR family transcriptional regulator